MKISITDMAGSCCPETVSCGSFDEALAARIEERVFESIYPVRRKPPLLRRLILIAAVISVLTGSAYATVNYTMNFDAREQAIIRPRSGKGYEIVGGVITFDAPAEGHYVGFTADYLPCAPSHETHFYEEDGSLSKWCSMIDCDDSETIFYNITANYSINGRGLVFGARLFPVREETVGDMQILELRGEYDEPERRVNYLLLFDRANGCLINISSEYYGFDELEMIAAGMEICVFSNTNPMADDNYSYIDLGRG